jgi:CubicO group peptidase (beta-lactamase class C family)
VNRVAPVLTASLLLLLAAGLLSLIPTTSAQVSSPPLDWLDAHVEQGLRDWGIPGLAIAIVKDDAVVLARGYGVRKLGEPGPVDERTLFGVASTTKAMTASALGLLVDEGRLQWDDPVVKYLPQFQLADPYVTRELTIRDVLTHRTGLGRVVGNRLQYMTHRSRDEVMFRMRFLPLERSFRSGFVYSNVLYMVAGQIIPAVTGASWDDFVRERLFEPLRMTATATSITTMDERNAAWPHQEIEGKVVPIPRRNFDNVGPAASVNSSAWEMAHWMRLHLGEPGVHEGRRILSASVVRELQQAQVPLPADDEGLAAYGLGWRIGQYRGRRSVGHTGATDGMNTNLVLVPEENLGVVVLTNTFNGFMAALANQVVDAYVGAPRRDWHREMLESHRRAKARVQELRREIHDKRVLDTRTSVPLERFAGRYADDLYGEVEVRWSGDGLALHFWEDETLVADLEHWHYDTFRAVWRNPAQREEFAWFHLGPDGAVQTLQVEFVLRPLMLQVGAYPSTYTRVARFERRRAREREDQR